MMIWSDNIRAAAAVFAISVLPLPAYAGARCLDGMVSVGTACVDTYEATLWRVSDASGVNKGLVKKIQKGKVTLDDLTAAGAVQLGKPLDDFSPCEDDGSGCGNVYAVSLPDVLPTRWASWFQAIEACANSGKRLPSNTEWQLAATGTPDLADDGTTTCNVGADTAVRKTGERTACVSARGAYDMIGNLREWVSDWMPSSTACPGWGTFSDDLMCFAGASELEEGPAALVRGGGFFDEAEAGIYSVTATWIPWYSYHANGFRCAR